MPSIYPHSLLIVENKHSLLIFENVSIYPAQTGFDPLIARDNYVDSNWRSNEPSHQGWINSALSFFYNSVFRIRRSDQARSPFQKFTFLLLKKNNFSCKLKWQSLGQEAITRIDCCCPFRSEQKVKIWRNFFFFVLKLISWIGKDKVELIGNSL